MPVHHSKQAKLEIRPYYRGDLVALAALEDRETQDENSFANIVRAHDQRTATRRIRVATIGNTPVGFCYYQTYMAAKESATLHRIMVDPVHRRKGIGSTLIKDCLLNCISFPDCNVVKTKVHIDDLQSQVFLRQFAFLASHPLRGVDNVEMTYHYDYLDFEKWFGV